MFSVWVVRLGSFGANLVQFGPNLTNLVLVTSRFIYRYFLLIILTWNFCLHLTLLFHSGDPFKSADPFGAEDPFKDAFGSSNPVKVKQMQCPCILCKFLLTYPSGRTCIILLTVYWYFVILDLLLLFLKRKTCHCQLNYIIKWLFYFLNKITMPLFNWNVIQKDMPLCWPNFLL